VGLINLVARLLVSNARKRKQAAPQGAREAETVEQPAGREVGDAGEIKIAATPERMKIFEEERRKIQEAVYGSEEIREEVSVEEGPVMDMSAMNKEIPKPIVREKNVPTRREISGPTAQQGKTPYGWQKINSLPPLKRAVILSEILGKPKGLER